MKISLLLLISLIGISSCGTKESETQNNPREVVKKSSVQATTAVKHKILEDTSHTDFTLYWKSFRQAIIENDTAKIMALTQFPLETRGPFDGDPIVKYHKKYFPQLLSAYLKEENYLPGDTKPTSFFEQIKKTQTLEPETIQENWARIGNLEFNKISNRWRLTFAYLDYPTIEKLQGK
ncbi:hypothetical protein [Adhaeribacter soli]|uniref:Uncharacterized protein n=1 Tax=Adhaeribacter soli TaxID=2607655 RepID=A0A5N1J5R1_9BACT|nr:hypothetical protein [Adhaeribacter soli]KAA9345523.1 hypothetical protein F0P94_00075 [Adhaeribacter soli]